MHVVLEHHAGRSTCGHQVQCAKFDPFSGPEGKQVGIGIQEISIAAEPEKFEAAAAEVIGIAIPKLVSVMAAAR